MVYNGKPYEQMDDFGVPQFLETPRYPLHYLWKRLLMLHDAEHAEHICTILQLNLQLGSLAKNLRRMALFLVDDSAKVCNVCKALGTPIFNAT